MRWWVTTQSWKANNERRCLVWPLFKVVVLSFLCLVLNRHGGTATFTVLIHHQFFIRKNANKKPDATPAIFAVQRSKVNVWQCQMHEKKMAQSSWSIRTGPGASKLNYKWPSQRSMDGCHKSTQIMCPWMPHDHPRTLYHHVLQDRWSILPIFTKIYLLKSYDSLCISNYAHAQMTNHIAKWMHWKGEQQ